MSRQKDIDKSDQASRELIRVLEDAIRAGVDSVELEYEDRNWIVYRNFGNTGLGAASIAKELQEEVINQIDQRAGLSRKSSGRMQVSLLGKNYEVAVKTHESFGESIYHLTLKERQEKEAATVKQKKQKKKPAARTKAPIRWEFDPDIPTFDFFEEGPLDETWNLQGAVDRFVYWLEEDRFLIWEAVACEEQGITPTPKQKKLLGSLLDFNDEDDDQILYIDEVPRPSEPWHIILNRIVPYLLIEPYKTFDSQDEVKCEGWIQIMDALQEHGKGLSLPLGVEQVEAVVPAELRHKLWLQFCFNDLSGLGQEESLTLDDPEECCRIEGFIDHLREFKESVAYFGLTLDSLLTKVVLPERDQPIFVRTMQEHLGLNSADERIADHL